MSRPGDYEKRQKSDTADAANAPAQTQDHRDEWPRLGQPIGHRNIPPPPAGPNPLPTANQALSASVAQAIAPEIGTAVREAMYVSDCAGAAGSPVADQAGS